MLLVAPGHDRRALDELLRRGADARAERLIAAISCGSPAAKPERYPVIDERFESVLKTSTFVRSATCRAETRRLVEPQLGVRLVGGEHEVEPPGELGEPLVELERRDRARRVVRVVDPEDGRPLEHRLLDRVEVGEEPVLLQQRHGHRLGVGEEGAALVDRVPGLGHDDRVLPGADHDLREREDRLLRAERRDDLRRLVELDVEAAPDPGGDRLAELGQADRARIPRRLVDRRDERVADERGGRLARVAHAEVEELDAPRGHGRLRLVLPHERVGGERGESGGERHA